MSTDDPHEHLRAAAQRKSDDARRRARKSIKRLHDRGEDVNFAAVARHANVSRQWLYSQPELRAEVAKLREAGSVTSPGVPVAQRASDASLRARLRVSQDQLRQLRDDNHGLREELSLAHAELRKTRRQR